MQNKLLLATNNPGKLRELKDLLKALQGVELISPAEIPLDLEIEETGSTYAENAILKAEAFCTASGLPCLADDSGLEVDALDGAPGLHSKRYLPQPGATDADRRAFLVANLKDYPRPWRARFRAVIAVAAPDGVVRTAEGVCEGEIIPEERGDGGFGYDRIFQLSGMTETMAELSEEIKNELSHRARAVQTGWSILEQVFTKG